MKESNKDKNKIKKLKQQINSQQKIINRLTKTISTKLSCSVCDSQNIIYIYCTNCGTLSVCKTHFRYIPRTRLCPLCNGRTVSRRWSMSVPKSCQ